MNIFIFTILYFVIVAGFVYLIFFLQKLIKITRKCKIQVDEIEQDTYRNLREAQFKSRELSKLVIKFINNKHEIMNDIIANLLMTFLPFTKLKVVLLLKRFLKKI